MHPVLRHWRRFTNMAKAAVAGQTVKEAIGQTMFTSFKSKKSVSLFPVVNKDPKGNGIGKPVNNVYNFRAEIFP